MRVTTDVPRDANGLEVLGPDECLSLLRSRTLGRIGLSAAHLPLVLPVHYVVIGDEIVFRARHGSTLAAATGHTVVAFEVDYVDDDSGSGWSVMVQGVARRHFEPTDGSDLLHTLDRWCAPHHAHLVAVSIDVVSGRRIDATDSRSC